VGGRVYARLERGDRGERRTGITTISHLLSNICMFDFGSTRTTTPDHYSTIVRKDLAKK
jgi:hypothetical protein